MSNGENDEIRMARDSGERRSAGALCWTGLPRRRATSEDAYRDVARGNVPELTRREYIRRKLLLRQAKETLHQAEFEADESVTILPADAADSGDHAGAGTEPERGRAPRRARQSGPTSER